MSLASNEPSAETSRPTRSPDESPRGGGKASRCLVILGMHRSGTSALTRVVNLLGADLSRALIPPKPSNVTGFWESESIFKIHNELLKEFGLMWHDYLPLPSSWEKTTAAREARARLKEYLNSEFSGSPLFTVKDPRICRLMPLWLDVLKERETEPLFLFCYRRPLEVAASLHSRDRLPWETSLLLWMRSYIEGEEATRGYRRLFISYDDLMENWRPVMQRVGDAFDLRWPRAFEKAAEEVDVFLSDAHRHHTVMDFDLVDDLKTRELLQAMYQALQDDPEGSGKGLRPLAGEATDLLNRKSDIFGPVLKYEHRARFELQTDKARVQRYNRRLEAKLKEQKKRERKRKQEAKLILALGVLVSLALGFTVGHFLTSQDGSGSARPAPVEASQDRAAP